MLFAVLGEAEKPSIRDIHTLAGLSGREGRFVGAQIARDPAHMWRCGQGLGGQLGLLCPNWQWSIRSVWHLFRDVSQLEK